MSESAEPIVGAGPQLSGDTTKELVKPGGSPAPTPASGETKVQSKFSEDLAQLGSAYGVDVNEFSGESDARAAIKLMADRYAKIGLNSPATQKPGNKPEVKPEEGFDESALDAKTSAYVKQLRKEAETARRESEEYQRNVEQARQEQANTAWEQVMGRANSVMDSVGSFDFGVKNEVNSVQQIKRETVFKTAGAILQGMVASGHPVPSIEKIMETALMVNGYTISKSQKTSPKASLPPGGATAAEVKKSASPVIRKPYDPLQITSDPSFRAGLNEIFGRA